MVQIVCCDTDAASLIGFSLSKVLPNTFLGTSKGRHRSHFLKFWPRVQQTNFPAGIRTQNWLAPAALPLTGCTAVFLLSISNFLLSSVSHWQISLRIKIHPKHTHTLGRAPCNSVFLSVVSELNPERPRPIRAAQSVTLRHFTAAAASWSSLSVCVSPLLLQGIENHCRILYFWKN